MIYANVLILCIQDKFAFGVGNAFTDPFSCN